MPEKFLPPLQVAEAEATPPSLQYEESIAEKVGASMTSGELFLPETPPEQDVVLHAVVHQEDKPVEAACPPKEAADIPNTSATVQAEPVAGFTEAEFEESFRRYSPGIIGHLASKGVPVQSAEDIVQESFFAVWRARFRLPVLPSSTYFYRTAINKHISSSREQQPVPVPVENLPLKPVYDDVAHIEQTLDTRQAIRQQSEHFHAIGELLMLDYTYQEIAEVLGLNSVTVRTRTNRLRKYLTESWAPAYRRKTEDAQEESGDIK